jgi:hypothetical protein
MRSLSFVGGIWRLCVCETLEFRAIIQGSADLLAERTVRGSPLLGGIAQLGERLHGMQEVIGSIPFTSTIKSVVESFFRSR